MNHHARERVLVLFTGVSDFFFAPARGAGTPAGQAAGARAGVPWAGAQAHTARLTDGGSIFFFSG